MKNIPIFFSFNNDYTIPAAVAFFSLLNKTKEDIFYDMFVLHSDITSENQNLLQDIVAKFKNGKLNFINTEGFLDEFWNKGNFEGHNTRNQFTVDAIVKCFGASFFLQYEKIIYSDVDIIFMDDISDLLNVNLDEKYIVGVKNPFMKWNQNELSHLNKEYYEMLKDSYIGGGIWVMNLKKIREDNLEQKMLEIINDDSIIKRWPDQDIINIACKNKIGFIPLNYISYPYLPDLLQKEDFISDYSREELYDSIINPKIIHYAAGKPWHYNAKKAEIWWDIFNYLKLPKTKIFTKQEENNFNKKIKKYKILFNIFLIISILLFLLNMFFYFYLIK